VIVPVTEGDAVYRAVLGLPKTAKRTVGFLLDSAFAQRSRQGTPFATIDREPQTFGIGTFDPGKSTEPIELYSENMHAPCRRGRCSGPDDLFAPAG
jgi:hypothetical protein